MIKKIGIKLLSAGACLTGIWGCMQVDGNSANQPQNPMAHASGLFTSPSQQLEKTIPAAITKRAASSNLQDSITCYNNYSTCFGNASTAYSACFNAATTQAQYDSCGTVLSTQEESCTTQYGSCLSLAGTTTSIVTVPPACQTDTSSSQSLDCLKALGVCPRIYNQAQGDNQTSDACEASYGNCINSGAYYAICDSVDSICHAQIDSRDEQFFAGCGIDINSLQDSSLPEFITAIKPADNCLCGGANGSSGSVFGNFSNLVYSGFQAGSQPPVAGQSFAPVSSPNGAGFTPASSPNGAGFTPASSPNGAGFTPGLPSGAGYSF